MSKSNRSQRRNRNHPGSPAGPARACATAAATARPFLDVPPPTPYSDLTHIRICPGNGNGHDNNNPAPEPAPYPPGNADPGEAPAGPGPSSRANAVKASRRSKLLFDPGMFEAIQTASDKFTADVKPVGPFEEYLVRELARSSAQDDKCAEQIIIDDLRVVERVGTSWDIDNCTRIEKFGTKLKESPEVVAGVLGRCKHGALYMIEKWSHIDDILTTNGCLDEPQRQACYDLLGIDHVYRNGNPKVPAGSDAQGLRALAARETARHRRNLEGMLNGTDATEKKMAALGIVSVRDSASKLLRADQNRARRRFSWAMKTLNELRAGADPASIIDPESGKPLAAGPRPTAVKPRAHQTPAAAPPPTSTSTPTPPVAAPPPPEASPAASLPPLPPLPEGLSAEGKEMFLVAAGALLGKTAASPADETGPPPTA